MQTPLQLDIQGFEPSAHVRELIETNVEKLAKRFGRTISCRVVVRAPGAHHQAGESLAISVHLTLPNGREVSVGRMAKSADRRYADPIFAIRDAFRRAMRQLGDQARRLEGNVRPHHSGGPAES